VGGDHAAALGHAGYFGLLYIIALGQRGLRKYLRRGHDPLTADTADQNVGCLVIAHDWLACVRFEIIVW